MQCIIDIAQLLDRLKLIALTNKLNNAQQTA